MPDHTCPTVIGTASSRCVHSRSSGFVRGSGTFELTRVQNTSAEVIGRDGSKWCAFVRFHPPKCWGTERGIFANTAGKSCGFNTYDCLGATNTSVLNGLSQSRKVQRSPSPGRHNIFILNMILVCRRPSCTRKAEWRWGYAGPQYPPDLSRKWGSRHLVKIILS
jgi:hypothetical protein